MFEKLTRYYAYYQDKDWQITAEEDSFPVFAKFEAPGGVTFLSLVLTGGFIYLFWSFPLGKALISSGFKLLIYNELVWIPIRFLAAFLGAVFLFYVLIILPLGFISHYVGFVYWVLSGVFKRYEKTKAWRESVDYQLIVWLETFNAFTGNDFIWQNYEIVFEPSSEAARQNLPLVLESYLEVFNRHFYAASSYDPRKKWSLDKCNFTLAGSMNINCLKTFHQILKYDLADERIRVGRVAFISKSEPYYIEQHVSHDGSGGG